MHRKLRQNQVVPTYTELHNLLVGYYHGEADFKEVFKAFNTRIRVAEEYTYAELTSLYTMIKCILKKLPKDKSVYRDRAFFWNCRTSLRYRMNKVCPTLFKVINQYSSSPYMFCTLGTEEECTDYITSNSCRKDLHFMIVPCIGMELQFMADHFILGMCMKKL